MNIGQLFYPELVRHEQLVSKKAWIKPEFAKKGEKADRLNL
jgi:hypothetical protein